MAQENLHQRDNRNFKTDKLSASSFGGGRTNTNSGINENQWSPAQKQKSKTSGRSLEMAWQREKMKYAAEYIRNIPVPQKPNSQSISNIFKDAKNKNSIQAQVKEKASGKGNDKNNELQTAQKNRFIQIQQAQQQAQQLQNAQISARISGNQKKEKKGNIFAKVGGVTGAGLFWYLIYG